MDDGIYDEQTRVMQSYMHACFNDSDDDDSDIESVNKKKDTKRNQEVIAVSDTSSDLDTSHRSSPRTAISKPSCSSTQQVEIITLDDSDNDDVNANVTKDENLTDISIEYVSSIKPIELSDDIEYTIKFFLDGKFHRINSTYQTPLTKPFAEHIKNCLDLDGRLIVRVDDAIIDLTQSPKSLGLKASTIMDAVYIYDRKVKRALPGQIKLKLQDGNRKNTQLMFAWKDKPIIELKKEYAESQKIDVSSLTFMFDGDIICDDQSPDDFDMDNDCVIDVFVKK